MDSGLWGALRNRLHKDEKSAVLVRDAHRNGYFALVAYSLLAVIAVWFPLAIAIVTTMLWAYWLTFSLRASFRAQDPPIDLRNKRRGGSTWLADTHARMSSLARPCDREEQGALFEGFHVMRHSLINRQESARAEIERPSGSPQLNVARQHVDSDPSLGFMFGHPRLGSQRDQDDARSSSLMSVRAF